MQKLFVLLAVICLGCPSYSQLRMAVIGGPHSASVKETNSLQDWETSIKPGYTSRSGLNLGALIEIPISSRWYFQPGILYMAKGRKFFMRNDSATSVLTDTITASSDMSVNYIEVPLNITYKIPLSNKVKFLLSAGPYVSFFYNGKQNFETRIYSSNTFKSEEVRLETGKVEGSIKTVDAGFNARAGFEIGNVLITGFVSRGLTSFYTASYDGSFKHQVLGASIGFWLNKVKQPTKPVPVFIPVKDTLTVPPTAPEVHVIADRDGDGMSDQADACPDQPGPVEFNGCPIPDSDGDGLNDTEDKCPREAGTKENNGCPVVQQDAIIKEIEKKVNFAARNIFFNANSDQLTTNSIPPLDEIVELLKSNPSFRITIEGHTDASGTPGFNKALSLKRAETVRNYLVQNGIEAGRLNAVGYGSDRPLSTNTTPEGRAMNRRVELKLIK